MVKRNAIMAGLSNGLKFIANAVVTIILARVLGPESFGAFAFAMTVAVFLGVVVDYGFNLLVVNQIAQHPESIERVVSRTITSKIILGIAALLVCTLFFVVENTITATLLLILTFSTIFLSLGQLFFSVFRGLNRFENETKASFLSNVLLILTISFAIWQKMGLIWIAIFFLLARGLFFVYALRLYLAEFGLSFKNMSFVSEGIACLREALPLGVMVISGLFFLSIDTFFAKLFFGNASVGIYQGGYRFVMAALIIAESVVSAYMPVLAKLGAEDDRRFKEKAEQMIRVSLVLSIPVSVPLFLSPYIIVDILFGRAYRQTVELLPLFGVLIVLRFLIAGYGTLLTVKNDNKQRAYGVMGALIVFVLVAYVTLPLGLKGLAFASIIAHCVLLGLYCVAVFHSARELFYGRRTVYLVLFPIVAFFVGLAVKPLFNWAIFLMIFISISVMGHLIGLSYAERKSLLSVGWLIRKTV